VASNKPVINIKDVTSNSASASGNKSIRSRLGNLENVTQAVLWVGLASVAAVIASSCAMVIDQMHFNNQTYRDQSSLNDLKYQELTKTVDLLSERIETLNKTESVRGATAQTQPAN